MNDMEESKILENVSKDIEEEKEIDICEERIPRCPTLSDGQFWL